jgi:hypothetical protein
MIPKLQKRGASFKDATAYVLHDPDKADTAERVAWTMTANLATKDPKWAWHEMVETYWAQGALKAASGHDARGRKNTHPVLHYTLSWAESDQPSPEEMKQAAFSSLKAIGLGEHEALIAAHDDKKHLHVHIVVNTVHPLTGMTAPLKFTKLDLSKWAEAYERERVIHCEERIKNNAERERIAEGKKLDATKLLKAASELAQQVKAPYVPVKHRATSRKQWFERQEIIERMKAMRKEIDEGIKAEKDSTWQTQLAERDALDKQTTNAIDDVLDAVKAHYRPYWRDLYRAQRREKVYLKKVLAYEARQKDGQPPSAKEAMQEAVKPTDRLQDLAHEHDQQRRILSSQQREDAKLHTDALMQSHREQFNDMRERQAAERKEQAGALYERTRTVTFKSAKESLQAEHDSAPTLERRLNRASERAEATKSFGQAAGTASTPAPNRADQIKRDMVEWRKQNAGKDQGREM